MRPDHSCIRAGEWGGAHAFPKFSPTLLGFAKAPPRALFRGLRQSISARLFVEPLGFQSVLGETRRVLDRVVSQTIRLAIEALEFGGVRRRTRPAAEPRAARIAPRATVATRSRGAPAPPTMRSAVARGRPAESCARRAVVSSISFSTASAPSRLHAPHARPPRMRPQLSKILGARRWAASQALRGRRPADRASRRRP